MLKYLGRASVKITTINGTVVYIDPYAGTDYSEPADLIRAIEQVSRGEPSLHPSIALQVLKELRRPIQKTPPPNALTAREVDVLRLVAKGLSNREIAAQLTTTEATIKTHVSSVLSKLHLANRVQAALLYTLQEGVTLPQDTPEDAT